MKKLLILVITCLLLYIFRADLLSSYARLFTVNTVTKNADLMIVLSGNIDTRPAYAAKLFHEGYSKQVFLTKESDSNGRYSAYVQSRNAYAKQYLKDLGVPAQNLQSLREEGVTSTFDKAYDAVLFLKKNTDVKHVILVTDAAHTFRTHYAFKKILSANNLDYIQLEMAAAPNDIFNENNWYKTERGIVFYLMETIKLLYYWVSVGNSTWIIPA